MTLRSLPNLWLGLSKDSKMDQIPVWQIDISECELTLKGGVLGDRVSTFIAPPTSLAPPEDLNNDT